MDIFGSDGTHDNFMIIFYIIYFIMFPNLSNLLFQSISIMSQSISITNFHVLDIHQVAKDGNILTPILEASW